MSSDGKIHKRSSVEETVIHKRSSVEETVWIGDPEVESHTVDLRRWLSEGKGYAVRSQQKANVIQWRALNPSEIFEAAAVAAEQHNHVGTTESSRGIARACARFGIVSIEGLSLTKRGYHGVQGLDDTSMTELERLKLDSPPSGCEELKGLTLVEWLGGLIAAASFRSRG